MVVHIIQGYETVEITLSSLPIEPIEAIESETKYHVECDEKWIKFCKEHNFHPRKDAYSKIYRLYLKLCSEGMI